MAFVLAIDRLRGDAAAWALLGSALETIDGSVAPRRALALLRKKIAKTREQLPIGSIDAATLPASVDASLAKLDEVEALLVTTGREVERLRKMERRARAALGVPPGAPARTKKSK